MLTREQVHAARVLFMSNVYDLDLLCSSFVLRLHNFLNTWRGGTEYQCVTTCRNILHICKDEDTVAVLKYLLLPETREDLNNVCLLPWCREVAVGLKGNLDQNWIKDRLQEIHRKRANFHGCGRDYTLNKEGREITLKVLREIMMKNPETTLAIKAVQEVLEDQRYQRTLAMMEILIMCLKCLNPDIIGKTRKACVSHKHRGYVNWLLGTFQFALLPEEQEEVTFLDPN